MEKERLWTRDFVALVLTNGLLFAGFHFLLPTLPIYVSGLGANGAEIGLIRHRDGVSFYIDLVKSGQLSWL